MRRVLIAMEGASCSDEAIQQFASLFPPSELTVFILAVIPPVSYPVELLPVSTLYHWQSQEALVALDRATSALTAAGFASFGIIRIGEPVDAILSVAQELEADLIVLGTHGRRGIKRLIRSSVAEAILAQADCDVMVNPFDGDTAHGSLEHPAA